MTWRSLPLKYVVREATPGRVSIKGAVADEPIEGLVPGYSASGQDVWLESSEAPFSRSGLVLSAVGARCGKVFHARAPKWGVVANTTVLMPQPGHDSRFLWYLLNDESFWDKGGAAQPYVRVSATLDRRLFLPNLDEQRRIADFLDAETARIDRLAATLDDLRKRIEERRSAYIHFRVTGAGIQGQVPTTLAWASTLPAAWPVVKVTYAARLGSGHTPSRSHPEWWSDCHIPWITTGEVHQVRDDRQEVITETRESISDLGLANSAAVLHPAGTVVLCRTASAGYSAVMARDMATSQDFATWTCGPRLDPYYLLWCLRAMRPDLLGRLAMGSTHKTIYMPDIQSIRIPLPPVERQREIVSEIRLSNNRLNAILDAVLTQQGLLGERRTAVITAAVTGRMDVTTARGVV